jgi:hypothetical protein
MQSITAQPTQPTYNPSKGYSRYSSIGATASLDPWLRASALPVPHHWPDSRLYTSACLLCVMQPNQSSLQAHAILALNSPCHIQQPRLCITATEAPIHNGTLGCCDSIGHHRVLCHPHQVHRHAHETSYWAYRQHRSSPNEQLAGHKHLDHIGSAR